MRTLAIVAFSGWLTCSGTASSPRDTSEIADLTILLHEDWTRLTSSEVEKRWPGKLIKRSSSDGICSGTIMLSDVATRGAEECWHCDTFLFDQVRSDAGVCIESLSAVTLVREVAGENDAEDLGNRLK